MAKAARAVGAFARGPAVLARAEVAAVRGSKGGTEALASPAAASGSKKRPKE